MIPAAQQLPITNRTDSKRDYPGSSHGSRKAQTCFPGTRAWHCVVSFASQASPFQILPEATEFTCHSRAIVMQTFGVRQ